MIFRLELFFRKLRRLLSRSEKSVRFLRLPKSIDTETVPGIIIIQLDGLSYSQFKKALQKRRMPFLKKLIRKEGYVLHQHYSGMPSSTPAVQAELFYGVRGAVPAFSFIDNRSGRIVRMFDPGPTAEKQEILEGKGRPLLAGGSIYSSIFTGGASESHFCASSLGWGELTSPPRLLSFFFLVVSNAYSFLKIATLMLIEFFLAIYDCISGLVKGHDLLKELKFIPTRAGICILLRELITIGAKVDIARGLPVVHINFIGYDEQAHRRGPSSMFAHWVLKGIDDAIARIWRAARQSPRRLYDVWIYSDHGQEEAIPYAKEYGRTIQEAVSDVFTNFAQKWPQHGLNNQWGIQSQRIRLLGGRKIQRIFPVLPAAEPDAEDSQLNVVSMGPVALVYLSKPISSEARAMLAKELCTNANVPLVLVKSSPGKVRAFTRDGEFILPRDRALILGAQHPFLDDVCNDLIDMCEHPEAGDFVLSGWIPRGKSLSFPLENGSHGGPGPEETRSFALLPGDTPLPERGRDYLRPHDLRRAASHVLGRPERRKFSRPVQQNLGSCKFRIMTYNVHSCIGMDGKISPERIARVIAQSRPDVVALQEVDVGKSRTGGFDQAREIAQCLEMNFYFNPNVRIEEELYGDAILSHFPMQLVKSGLLPGLRRKPHLEARGALWVSLKVGKTIIQCINTHLGLSPSERLLQVKALLGSEWLGNPACRHPVILCGDFNASPLSPACRKLMKIFMDAQDGIANQKPVKTFFSRYPLLRIDHVFVSQGIEVTDFSVPKNDLARVASDHLPLTVEVRIN